MKRGAGFLAALALVSLLAAPLVSCDDGEAGLLAWIEKNGGQVRFLLARWSLSVRYHA